MNSHPLHRRDILDTTSPQWLHWGDNTTLPALPSSVTFIPEHLQSFSAFLKFSSLLLSHLYHLCTHGQITLYQLFTVTSYLCVNMANASRIDRGIGRYCLIADLIWDAGQPGSVEAIALGTGSLHKFVEEGYCLLLTVSLLSLPLRVLIFNHAGLCVSSGDYLRVT